MKILVATNYLKGSLSSIEAANIISDAIYSINNSIKVEIAPIADGGDGTLEVFRYYKDSEEIVSYVKDPLNREHQAKWLVYVENNEKIAIIEAARANGLYLLKPEEYNPLITTSYGVGQLIAQALDHECTKIIITLGGSATNDAGSGLISSLGVKLLDKNNNIIEGGGLALSKLKKIDISDLDQRIKDKKIVVACDVINPLCGKNGASFVYGPQKGAKSEEVELLDKALSNFANLTKKTVGKDYKNFKGAGAAGGIGFALLSYFGAEFTSGFDVIAEVSKLEEKITGSNLILTTEGSFDTQSLQGKASTKIAKLAKKNKIPTIVIAGSVQRDLDYSSSNVCAAFSLVNGPITLEKSIADVKYLLFNSTRQIIKTFLINS